MYVDKYTIENYGSTWSNGKQKKNQLIGEMNGLDIDLKKFIRLLEEYHETFNGEYAHTDIDVKITFKETKGVYLKKQKIH